MDGKICVDASFALKLVLTEADSDLAQAEWQNWLHAGLEITAPDLFTYETTSVLRNRVTQNEADEALEILAGLEITYHQPSAIQQSAWVGLAKAAKVVDWILLEGGKKVPPVAGLYPKS